MIKKSFWQIINEYYIRIPRIQRDYIYGIEEESIILTKNRLLDDVLNSLKHGEAVDLGFIYGSVNMSSKVNDEVFEPLDGQQRLTTLWLLSNILRAVINVGGTDVSDDYYKLKKFNYDVRVTTSRFCKHLIEEVFSNVNDHNSIIKTLINFMTHDYITAIIDSFDTDDAKEMIKSLNCECDIDINKNELSYLLNEFKDYTKIIRVEKIKKHIFTKIIKSQKWYHSDYDSDINIGSIIGLVFDIMDKVLKTNKSEYLKMYNNIKDLNCVSFEFLMIKDVDNYSEDKKNSIIESNYLFNKDDVYIKINARGLPLTPFENFKAQLLSVIERNAKESTFDILKSKINIAKYFKDNQIYSNDDLYKCIKEKVSSKIDLEFEEKIYETLRPDSENIGKEIDNKRLYFIKNIFMCTYMMWLLENGINKQRDLRYILKIIENTNDKSFPYEFTEWTEKTKEIGYDIDDGYFIEQAILESLIIYDRIMNCKEPKYFLDILCDNYDESKNKTIEILYLISYVVYLLYDYSCFNNMQPYKNFIDNILSNVQISNIEQHALYESELINIVDEIEGYEQKLIELGDKEVFTKFGFNEKALKNNLLNEYFKIKYKVGIDSYNKNNNCNVDYKILLNKFEKDFGPHFAFVFEFFGAIDMRNDYYEFNVDKFIEENVDYQSGDLTKIKFNEYNNLLNYISYGKHLELNILDVRTRIELIKSGYVLYKYGNETDNVFYFSNNNDFNDPLLSFDYIMRGFDKDFAYKIRKIIYNIALGTCAKRQKNRNIDITDINYWKRAIFNNEIYLKNYFEYKLKAIENKYNRYYYIVTEHSVFSGRNYDLYLLLLYESLKNSFNSKGDDVNIVYKQFVGEDKWEFTDDNRIEISYKEKKCFVELDDALKKFIINGTKKSVKRIDLIDNNGDLNILSVITYLNNLLHI